MANMIMLKFLSWVLIGMLFISSCSKDSAKEVSQKLSVNSTQTFTNIKSFEVKKYDDIKGYLQSRCNEFADRLLNNFTEDGFYDVDNESYWPDWTAKCENLIVQPQGFSKQLFSELRFQLEEYNSLNREILKNSIKSNMYNEINPFVRLDNKGTYWDNKTNKWVVCDIHTDEENGRLKKCKR